MYYFDTSILVPLVLPEPTSNRVEAYARALPLGSLYLSHWGRTEVASAVSREVRLQSLSPEQGRRVWDRFSQMVDDSFRLIAPQVGDFSTADAFVLQFATALRAGDALHLAIAKNRGAASLLTLDRGLIKAARLLGIPASHGIRLAS